MDFLVLFACEFEVRGEQSTNTKILVRRRNALLNKKIKQLSDLNGSSADKAEGIGTQSTQVVAQNSLTWMDTECRTGVDRQ